jgi:hypothetical protein
MRRGEKDSMVDSRLLAPTRINFLAPILVSILAAPSARALVTLSIAKSAVTRLA